MPSSFDDASKLVDDVISDFGKIDVLVNNAGIKKDNLLMRMDKEDFDSVVNTNLSSVFNLTKSSIRTFLKQRSGSIINISSVVGVKGNAGQSNYSASKAGIIGFSKSVALELGSRNIRSNVIAPGFIETDMTGLFSQRMLLILGRKVFHLKEVETQAMLEMHVYFLHLICLVI
jgi:3-oxoacyl-[acyl-carrier protein] reductase